MRDAWGAVQWYLENETWRERTPQAVIKATVWVAPRDVSGMLLSIVMATRNSARLVGAAIDSVEIACSRTGGIAYEILVADGASKDETRAVVASRRHVRIVSEADSGIYDGMSRALAAARGEYVLIVNSDDMLLPGALAPALSSLRENGDAGLVSADAAFGASAEDCFVRCNDRKLSPEGALFGVPAINARLYRLEFLRRVGPLRQDLGLAGDREWLLRIASSGPRGVRLAEPLYLYRIHEGSATIAGTRAARGRVYDAEARLAQSLSSELVQPVRGLALAAGAIVALKTKSRGMPLLKPATAGLGDLLRGAGLSMRWRGRLSGY
jgi:glycosyltransferase involved in cell wall biosynthesis